MASAAVPFDSAGSWGPDAFLIVSDSVMQRISRLGRKTSENARQKLAQIATGRRSATPSRQRGRFWRVKTRPIWRGGRVVAAVCQIRRAGTDCVSRVWAVRW
jgi:hypothetical protein